MVLDSHHCPYKVGSEFALIFYPASYNIDGKEPTQPMVKVNVKVLQTYTFTLSQTMKVTIKTQESQTVLPEEAFFKVYDRRYLKDRLGEKVLYPWDPEREAIAEKSRADYMSKLNKNRREGPLNVDGLFEDSESSSVDHWSSEENFRFDSDSEREETQWERECVFRRRTRKWFTTEVRAYNQLQCLQGVCIPRFFGSTQFDETSLAQMPPGINIETPGILIEFIEGITVNNIEGDSQVAVQYPHIGQAVVDGFEKINQLGVLHGDVRTENVIIRNCDGRAFVLDFALSAFRRTRESDKRWAERVECEWEARAMRLFLCRRNLFDWILTSPLA
jgi:tRNA A-37 threonylcarbamoyl transferase component Bud32